MCSMDAETVREMLGRHFEYAGSDPDAAHDMYHEDAVLEFPQSGERGGPRRSHDDLSDAARARSTPTARRLG